MLQLARSQLRRNDAIRALQGELAMLSYIYIYILENTVESVIRFHVQEMAITC